MMIIPGGTQAFDILTSVMTMRIKTGSSDYYPAARYVSDCTLNSGKEPSNATLSHPVKGFGPGQWDRQMYEIALKKAGPLGNLQLRQRGAVSILDSNGHSTDILTGWLVEHTHNITHDFGITQLFDDKYELGQITVMGCLVYDPQSGQYYWDFGRQCIYNAGGWPDCIDSPLGACHAPTHRTGYVDDPDRATYDEPTTGNAVKKARTWYVADVINNLRLRHVFGTIGDKNFKVPGRYISQFINWPQGIGNSLPGANRPCKSINLQNSSLLDALQCVIRKAGQYDIYFEPANGFESTLKFLDMGQTDASYGVTLRTPDYDNATPARCVQSGVHVVEGYISESVKSYFDSFAFIGDPPAIEVMLSNKDDDATVLKGLEFAFLDPKQSNDGYKDSSYFKEFKSFVISKGGNDAALKMGFRAYPLIANGFRVALDCNPFKGSKYDAVKPDGRCRFRPQNITGYASNNDNPRDWQPFDVVAETYYDPNAESADSTTPAFWQFDGVYTNLTLSADSTIAFFSNLRDTGVTWYIKYFNTHDNTGYDGSSNNIMDWFNLRPFRINCTVEANWPIIAQGSGDPNGTGARVNQSQLQTCYAVAAEPGEYCELLRSQYAHPEGLAGNRYKDIAGTIQTVQTRTYPERDTQNNEMYSDIAGAGRMQIQANQRQKDVRRVEKSGLMRLPMLNGALKPGMCTQVLSKGGIEIVGVLKSVRLKQIGRSERNPADRAADTWIEMGPADWSTLQLAPSSGAPSSSVGTSRKPDHSPDDYNPEDPVRTPDTYPQTPPQTSGNKPPNPQPAKSQDEGSGYQGPTKASAGKAAAAPASSRASNGAGMDDDDRAVAQESRDRAARAKEPAAKPAKEEAAKRAAGIYQDGKLVNPSSYGGKTADSSSSGKNSGESYADFQKRHPIGNGHDVTGIDDIK